ncbi:glyoxalase [Actinocatenispora thailandica]|uniref:Glyoxalase n=1 Tax=Actinocatenispora thailandica TaxID=227318 RepID=A0A7R7HYU2_9ACTN|nr:VOC family protein [Actinocatenispora thailandica]BCJ36891.1 glyoxalase [Actinocatenispora thailandica]
MTHLALHLVVDDPQAAAEWYSAVLGARQTSRVDLPDGRPLTVELRLGDTVLAVAGEMPAAGNRTPRSLGGSPTAFHLPVPDVDAAWHRALAAGATEVEPPHDAFWGDRTAQVLDPSGHRWAFDQHLRDVPPDELAAHVAAMFA